MQLPMTDSIQQVLKQEADGMEQMYNDKIKEHDANVQKYEEEKSTYSEFVRNTKENDLMEASAKIQQYLQNANQQLQKRKIIPTC